MKTKILQSAAFVLAAALAGVPAISHAATAAPGTALHVTYQTSLQEIPGLGAPWTGSLQLTIEPDGIIQGYYHPADNMADFIPVTGAREGDRVWLEIGRDGRLRVTGTWQNGRIAGSAIDQRTLTRFAFDAAA